MKILVPVKRVIDHTVRVRVEAGRVVNTGVRMAINPYDENALEAALVLREQGRASRVIAVAVGADKSAEQLRTALAMGADEAILVEAGEDDPETLTVARCIKALAVREGVRLILTGKQAIDDDAADLAPMVAGMLGWGQATFAVHCAIQGDMAVVQREVDGGGTQTLHIPLPAVVSCDLTMNTPRKAALPAVIKAKKAPLEVLTPATLGVENTHHIRSIHREMAPPRVGKGIVLKDVAALVDVLRKRV